MSAYKSGLDARTIGEERRKLFGTGPLYIEADPSLKPVERWFCDSGGCNRWRDESGEYHGDCVGYCYAY